MSKSLNFNNGFLHIIIGPMYSGKTTEILRRLNIYSEMGFDTLYINTKLDNRSDNDFSTHSSFIGSCGKIDTLSVYNLEECKEKIEKYKIIGIDEAQMFKGLKDFVLKLVEDGKKTVIIGGLNGDFLRNKFGEMIDLIPYCDSVEKLTPFCLTCCQEGSYTNALFSKRLDESNKETVVIGGKNEYIPVCRKCYLK